METNQTTIRISKREAFILDRVLHEGMPDSPRLRHELAKLSNKLWAFTGKSFD